MDSVIRHGFEHYTGAGASRAMQAPSRAQQYANLDKAERSLREQLVRLPAGDARETICTYLSGIEAERRRLDVAPDDSAGESHIADPLDLRHGYREPQIDSFCPFHASNIATNGILRSQPERIQAYLKARGENEQLDGEALSSWHNAEVRQFIATHPDRAMVQRAQSFGLLSEVKPVQFNVACKTMNIDARKQFVPDKLDVEFIGDAHPANFEQTFAHALGQTPNAVTRVMILAGPGVIPLDGSAPASASNHWLNLAWRGTDDDFREGRGRWTTLNSTRGDEPRFLCVGGPDAQGAMSAMKRHIIGNWSKRTYDPQAVKMQYLACLPV